MSLDLPYKIVTPFAKSGDRNTIPETAVSGGAANAANFNDGFPQVTMTPKSAGGIPPAGRDMNGILYTLSTAIQYLQAGMIFKYDANFASAISGYNKGALLLQNDESGIWVSDIDGNTSNPETSGDWHPLDTGKASITVAGANIILTRAQAAHPIIEVSGTLTNNVTVTFPPFIQIWTVMSSVTSGNYNLTFKPSSGAGVVIENGKSIIACNGTDIVRIDGAENAMKTGTIYAYGGSVPPGDDLLCNGQAVSRTLQSSLFSAIGTQYGAGDGSTTFNVPNITVKPLGINEIYCIKV